jgi:oxygen-dependent protoporphyrinogen oxidase
MSPQPVPHVVVIGGGISGLAAARRLAARFRVSLLEATDRLGGKLAPIGLEGVRLDGGAESFLARRPEALDLVTGLGLNSRLEHPTSARPTLYVDGQSQPLPPSLLGVPTDLGRLEGLLSPHGYERACDEPERDWPAFDGDVAIGRLVDEHFGAEVTDRLVEPMLGGVYAGQARALSLAAVAPALFERARTGGSLLRHAQECARSGAEGPVFAGLRGGVAGLVDALVADLADRGIALRPGTTVRRLEPRPGGGFGVIAGDTSAATAIDADAVVVAAPGVAAGRLLGPLVPEAGEWAARLPYASLAVVTLVVRGVAPAASGLLVPPGALPTVKALTHSSTKWSWVREAATTRWGGESAVVRASVGRLGEERLLQLPDEALLQRTFAEVCGLPGWADTRLITGHVSRWGGALPQYQVGHVDRVRRLREALRDRPGLTVCGAGMDGIGIAACLAGAAIAASIIEQELSGEASELSPAHAESTWREIG